MSCFIKQYQTIQCPLKKTSRFIIPRDGHWIDLFQDTIDLVSTGRKSLVLTKASLSILIRHTLGRWETNDSMIILLFPSLMSITNQLRIVNQNYIENEDLVSRFNSRSISCILRKVYWSLQFDIRPPRWLRFSGHHAYLSENFKDVSRSKVDWFDSQNAKQACCIPETGSDL